MCWQSKSELCAGVLSFGLQESKLKIDIQCSGLHPKATQLGRVGNEHQKRSRSTWPSDDQQINYGHESKGSQMHHCWRRKLWVKTQDDEQIYCAKTTMYFQINAPLYCRTVLKYKYVKKAWTGFFHRKLAKKGAQFTKLSNKRSWLGHWLM